MESYILFALLISFLWGIQPVIHKHLLGKYNAVTIMLLSTLIYFILIIALSISKPREVSSDLNKMSVKDFMIIIFTSIITVFIANIIYYYVLKDHESSIISALIYSSPVFTLIIAYLFLKERLNKYSILGIIAIVFGVILISNNNITDKELEYFSNK